MIVDILDGLCDCVHLLKEQFQEACRRYLIDTLRPEYNVFEALGRYSMAVDVLPEKLAVIMSDLYRLYMVRMTETFHDVAVVTELLKSQAFDCWLISMKGFFTVDIE